MTAYRHWQERARELLEPLSALMLPGRAELAIAGPASDHDAAADRLESFARPMLLAAFWLQSELRAEDREFAGRVGAWFRAGLAIGSDPSHPAYWGPDANYHQDHVEMGLMAIALQIAGPQLWEPLSAEEKDRLARWLGSCRGGGIVNNNHLFMSVHILEFLGSRGYGHRTDGAVIVAHLNELETMHRGGGWFEDGINQAYDHYNAYAFHFYGLWWARLYAGRDAGRAARWRGWARSFINDYQHLFAASGEHPAFGRSIMYRFNAVNVFGLAAAEDCTAVAMGTLRRIATRNLDFFLDRPEIRQEQGCLNFGFTDRFDRIGEAYSCAGSPYWAAKGFAALVLKPDHPFWTEAEAAMPAEEGDFVRVIRPAGLVVRGVGGEVEILNAGSMVSNLMIRYGAWKWSKVAYRTGVQFTFSFPEPTTWSLDGALTMTIDDGRIFGRHSTTAVELETDHIGYSSNYGIKHGQVNAWVQTYVWWRKGWLLQVHVVDARQAAVFKLGGYALPLSALQAEGLARGNKGDLRWASAPCEPPQPSAAAGGLACERGDGLGLGGNGAQLRGNVVGLEVERVVPNALSDADCGPTSSALGTTRSTAEMSGAFNSAPFGLGGFVGGDVAGQSAGAEPMAAGKRAQPEKNSIPQGKPPAGTAGGGGLGESAVALQPLVGFQRLEWDLRVDDSTERRHVRAPYHATPVAVSERLSPTGAPVCFAALSYAGAVPAHSEWDAWTVVRGDAQRWQFRPPSGEADQTFWEINHWALPALA